MEKKRRISLEQDFMNYKINDLLFALMAVKSTYHPEAKKLYLTKRKYAEDKKEFLEFCGNIDKNGNYKEISLKTLGRHLQKLIDNGLIREDKLMIRKKETPVYIINNFDNPKFKYQLVDKEMLDYLVHIYRQQVIKIYTFLLSMFNYYGSEFKFTNKTIMKQLGYNFMENEEKSKYITYILDNLKRVGIIDYEIIYEAFITETGETVPTPKKRLKFVAKTLKDFNAEIKEK